MSNLLQETIEVLKENSKTFDDVVWIGCKEFRITLAQFKELANKHYDSGYGSAEVAKNLLIVGEDWWLERGEYDGAEWWEFKKKKYCSHKCASKNNISYLKALKKREEIINKRNFQIQETINEWAKNNKELVINCPYNQIETCLAPLFNLVYENFNVKDKRTFTIAYCNTNSRKQFLKELKTFCENIC